MGYSSRWINPLTNLSMETPLMPQGPTLNPYIGITKNALG